MAIAFVRPSRRPVLADLISGTLVRDAVLVIGAAGLVGAAAQISISTSLSPVPFTLQTGAVLATGAALGSARGLMSMLIYVTAGIAGVPWFAGHTTGFGPSAGYLFGFVLASALVGHLARRGADRTVWRTALLMLVGNLVIYVPGVLWLMHETPTLSFGRAVHYGVVVFLLSDAAKLIAAALVFPLAWKLAGRKAEQKYTNETTGAPRGV